MATTLELPSAQSGSFEAYRNIYTSKVSQDLFDDLTDPSDFPILQSWDNNTSQIQHGVAPTERVFQYGNAAETICVFEKVNWRRGRFGDGIDYGVWYGALEAETSILEALYWVYKNSKEDIANSTVPVVIDRRMFKAQIETTKLVDLRKLTNERSRLTDSDYIFCQEYGAYAVKNGIDLYFTPSARNAGGTCVPIFTPKAIKSDKIIYYIHFTFARNGEVQITTDEDRMFKLPDSWG